MRRGGSGLLSRRTRSAPTDIDPSVKRLRAYIDAYEKEAAKRWDKAGKEIINRYADQRSEVAQTTRRMGLLWSNVETLKPFLYSATPKPIVSARHDDAPQVVRIAAEVAQRALAYSLAEQHFGTALRNARDDYLLPGRGTAWVRYKPTIVPQEVQVSEAAVSDDPAQLAVPAGEGEDGTEQVREVVGWEEVITDYVNWRDFGHNVAPTWEEVDVVWRRVPMDRDALVERFGEEIGSKVPLDWRERDRNPGSSQGASEDTDRAAVYECWWKSKRKAFWISKSFPQPLDEKDDPLKLDHFFPCPRPIYATLTTESLIPIPDYAQYQDQAQQIDDLTSRIASLTKSIKAAGVYDGSVEALKTILNEGHDNTLVPVESWAAFNEKGGLLGAMQLLPMKDLVETLLALHEAREKQKADLYEVSGMSDIIRGNTNPDETATAQQIKTNFASKRLAERQAEVARFAGNLVAIMGNVIAMHFSIDTLRAMTGMKLLTDEQKAMVQQTLAAQQQSGAPAMGNPIAPPVPAPMGHNGGPPIDDDVMEALDKPTWEDVLAVLQDEPQRRFSIDIETDSLVAADDQAQIAARTQFLEAVGTFMEKMLEAATQFPAMVPLLGKMLMFAVQGFRVGRDLVDAFQSFVDKMEAIADQPQQPKPDPQMAKVQGELQLRQQQQQFEQQQAAKDAAHRQALELADQQHRHRMDIVGASQDAQGATAAQQADTIKAHVDAALAQQAEQMKAETAVLIAHIQNLGKIEVARITADAAADAQAEAHEEEQGA